MQLNDYQKKLIADIDKKMIYFLDKGIPQDFIRMKLINTLPQVKDMVNTVDNKQIDLYLHAYQGFRRYVRAMVLG